MLASKLIRRTAGTIVFRHVAKELDRTRRANTDGSLYSQMQSLVRDGKTVARVSGLNLGRANDRLWDAFHGKIER